MFEYKTFTLNQSSVVKQHYAEINDIYELHRLVWDHETEELYGRPAKPDEFLFNESISALYLDQELVAYCLSRSCHLKCTAEREQDWLECWPKEILDDLTRTYEELIISNHLTVHPDYRRTVFGGVNIPFALIMLNSMYLLDTGFSGALGSMRLSRSTHKLSADLGATVLKKSHPIHGVDAQLVLFKPEDIPVDNFPNEIKNVYSRGVFV